MTTKGALVQIVASLFIGLGNVSMAYMMSWPSYTLKIFKSNHSPLTGNFTLYHESLVGSVPMLGSMVGTIFGGIIADGIGRKRGDILCGLVLVLGSSIQCTARSVYILIFSRLLLGLGGGLHAGICTLMVGEFSAPSIRGSVVSISGFGFAAGVLLSYTNGWLCSYDMNNYIFLTLNVLFVVCISTLKETPIYLLKNGRDKEALKSLKFYRGMKETSTTILDELSELKCLVKAPKEMVDMTVNGHRDPEKEKLRNDLNIPLELSESKPWKTLLSSKASLRALATCSSLIMLVVSMGMIAIQTYAGVLFTEAVPDLSPDLCSIALAVANIAGSCLPMFLSDYFGRRILLITSSTLVSCCAVTLGVLISWPIAPGWLIPVTVLLYCFVYQLGAGSVPYTLNAECYIPEVSTLCIIISLSAMWVVNFISLAIFGPLVNLLTLGGTFFVYAFVAAFTAVYSYLIMPETSGLTTDIIQSRFAKGFLQIGCSNKQ